MVQRTTGNFIFVGNLPDFDPVEGGDRVMENYSALSGHTVGPGQFHLVEVTAEYPDDATAVLFNHQGGAMGGDPITYTRLGDQNLVVVSTVMDAGQAIDVEVTLGDGSTQTVELYFIQMANGDVFLTQSTGSELDNTMIQSIRFPDNLQDNREGSDAFFDDQPEDVFSRYSFDSLTIGAETTGTFLFVGNAPDFDPIEENSLAENSSAASGLFAGLNDLQLVSVTGLDTHFGFDPNLAGPDGRIALDNANTGQPGSAEEIVYTKDGQDVSTLIDTQFPVNVEVTFADGSTQTMALHAVQMANGDVFLTQNSGDELENATIQSVRFANVADNSDAISTYNDGQLGDVFSRYGFDTLEIGADEPAEPATSGNFIFIGNLPELDTVEDVGRVIENTSALSGHTVGLNDLELVRVSGNDPDSSGGLTYDHDGTQPAEITYTRDGQDVSTVIDAGVPVTVSVTFADGSRQPVTLYLMQMANGDTFLTQENGDELDNAAIQSIQFAGNITDNIVGGNGYADGETGDVFGRYSFDSLTFRADAEPQPPETTTGTFLFVGNTVEFDPTEGNTVAENSSAASGLFAGLNDLQLISVTGTDSHFNVIPDLLGADGAIALDNIGEPGSAEAITYTKDGQDVSTIMDSQFQVDVEVTYADGSTEVIQLYAVQMANGDVFLTQDDGDELENVTIQSVRFANVVDDAENAPFFNDGDPGDIFNRYGFDTLQIGSDDVDPAETTGAFLFIGNTVELDPIEGNRLVENASAAEGLFAGLNDLDLIEVTGIDSNQNGNPNIRVPDGSIILDNLDNGSAEEITYTRDGQDVSTFMDSQLEVNVEITFGDGSTQVILLNAVQMANGDVFLTQEIGNELENVTIQSARIIEVVNDDSGTGFTDGQPGDVFERYDFDSLTIGADDVDPVETTGNFLFIGNAVEFDPTEGNTVAENSSAASGLTAGLNELQLIAVTGIDATANGNPNVRVPDNAITLDNLDNGSAEEITYTRDGQAVSTVMDSQFAVNVEVTFGDGSTQIIELFAVQMANGDVFLTQDDGDELENVTIQSVRFLDVADDRFTGTGYLDGDPDVFRRYGFDNLRIACFCAGTLIETESGERRIETLSAGDMVRTHEGALRPIAWIGHTRRSPDELRRNPKLRPVRMKAGSLGPNSPETDLLVSRQHRMLLISDAGERMTGSREVLVPAIKLLALDGVDVVDPDGPVDYYHILLDEHDVILANGAPSETLLIGKQALLSLGDDYVEEIRTLLPDCLEDHPAARPIVERQRMVDQIL